MPQALRAGPNTCCGASGSRRRLLSADGAILDWPTWTSQDLLLVHISLQT